MANLIEWTSDLNTGIDVIDNQHKRIVAYINQLHEARQRGSSREEVGRVIEELVDYTLSHFSFEEAMMEDAGYRFIGPHKKVHELFVRRVGEYQQRFKLGDDVAGDLQNTLTTWLINHIKREDADYARIVKEKLVQMEEKKKGWLSRFFGG